MLDFVTTLTETVLPFLVVLTVLVFVHELGHYWVARLNGVRVRTFSIGFGRELVGWTDGHGTRWKIGWLPLGGYVSFFGDASAASTPDTALLQEMAPEEREEAFQAKSLGQRTAIVAAGPIANFVFAVFALAVVFATVGRPFTPADVGQVVEDSAAARAGFLPGDQIVEIGGTPIARFEDIQRIVRLSPERPLDIVVIRDGGRVSLTAVPDRKVLEDRFGNVQEIGLLGISRSGFAYTKLGPLAASWYAVEEVGNIMSVTVKAVGQMIAGTRSSEELGGPIRIAQMSGEIAQDGIVPLVWFMVVLSVNLGLINLFPVPMLDGGHLLYYACEAVRGRPLGIRVQEFGFRIGLAMILTLMIFATWNDLSQLSVFEMISD